MTTPYKKPMLSWEYIGDELAIFWINPYQQRVGIPTGGEKEKIASFWWPFHPGEKTTEVETIFEDIAKCLIEKWNESSRDE